MNETSAAPSTAPAAERLAELGERYFRIQHEYDPLNATLLGLSDFDHLLGDPSRSASSAASTAFAEVAVELESLDPSELDEDGRLDHAVLTVLDRGAQNEARHALWAGNASAKSYVSRQGLVFQAVPAMTVADGVGAERYLSRLGGIADYFLALGRRYLEEAGEGRVPTALGVRHSVDQLTDYLEIDLEHDTLLRPTTATAAGRAVRAEAVRLIDRSVRPAMVALAQRLRSELAPLGRPDDRVGACFLPDGTAGYQAALDRNTTLDLGPEEIHQIGRDELAALEDRWSEVGQRALGISDVATISERMRADPALRFESREQMLAVAGAALRRATEAQPGYFLDPGITDCVIEEINPVEAQDAALAYYRPPAVDGSRPGAHCLLTTDPQQRFRFELECLAFHESVPGHHLQLATAQLLDIPRYRRHLDVEACSFNEGWGLYSEQLADELGLYSSDLDRLGMLSHAALRACRLVVDTGLHHLGWSRQRAVQFMWEHTATTEANVRNEVDRYIAWPGQAVSYLIGKQQILRLREQARAELGARFSLPDFHTAVLGAGALPLPALARQVDRWVAAAA